MELAQMLKRRRTEKGMTLLEIAKKVGVSEATVQRWESGNIKNIRYERLAKLAEALDVSPAYLMGWEETSNQLSSVGKSLKDVAYELDMPIEMVEKIMADNDVNSVDGIQKILAVSRSLIQHEKKEEPPMPELSEEDSSKLEALLEIVDTLTDDEWNRLMEYAVLLVNARKNSKVD